MEEERSYKSIDFHRFMQKVESLSSYEKFHALYVQLGFLFESYIKEKHEAFHRSPSYWFCNLDHETQSKVLDILLES